MGKPLLVKRLQEILDGLPPARHDLPWVFLMLAGGMECVTLLTNLLLHTDFSVHTHPIEPLDFLERAGAEEVAICAHPDFNASMTGSRAIMPTANFTPALLLQSSRICKL